MTAPGSLISARGGINSAGGGEIDLLAGGALVMQSDPDVSGLDGGFLELDAGGKLIMQGASASGRGDAGTGGCVDVVGGAGSEIRGTIDATAATGLFMSGGCGGLICVDGGLGDVTIAAAGAIDADGASPDGGGGQVALMARGTMSVAGNITARGPAGGTCGGCVCFDAGYDVNLLATGTVDASGGDTGGEVDLVAARDMTISGAIGASGRRSGSLGGDVSLRAGERVPGSLVVGNTIDVRSDAPCTAQNGCGQGGTTDLVGCNLVINSAGALLAGGPHAGQNDLTARDQLSVRGVMNAVATVATGAAGLNRFIYRAGQPPLVQGNGVQPGPMALVLTTCPEKAQTEPPCLSPCPTCGDGVVEFPETCDLGMIPPTSCGGCSIYCQLEDCNDGRICTGDSCDPTFGCVNQPTPGCVDPTETATGTPPTPTATPTATAPPTASPTSTPTSSPTGSVTATATISHTAAPTTSATPSPTSVATATITAPPPATATATSTATATGTATATTTTAATATARDTDTPPPEPTTTPPPACPGDCDRSGSVTVNELILGVNIALGNADIGVCAAFDTDGDTKVSISELVAAVSAAINGC